jgi:hypothetical protein
MTWQRIDDNILVDDSLVTCMEYQLFIDEMCELEKYYQPDHWTSFQYTNGQAREPILGIRHHDAVAFCDWLTCKENSLWIYRLLSREEAQRYPINAFDHHLKIGYWIDRWVFKFAWIGNSPANARGISESSYQKLLTHVIDPKFSYRFEGVLAETYNRWLDIKRARTSLEINVGSGGNLSLWLEAAREVFNEIDINNLPNLKKVEEDTVDSIPDAIKFNDYAFNKIGDRHIGRDFILNLDLSEEVKVYLKLKGNASVNRNEVLALLDIFTLQERILGRSPAFEGIRIVKQKVSPKEKEDFNNRLEFEDHMVW